MTRRARLAPALATLLLLLSLGGCASTVHVGEGDRAMVRLFDGDTGALLELANQSHPQWQDVYSHARASAGLKLAPEVVMSELLTVLDDQGYESYAAQGPAPVGAPGIDGWIEVRRGDQISNLTISEGSLDRPRLSAFVQMKLAMLEAYQSVGGLQLIENPSGHDLFRGRQ